MAVAYRSKAVKTSSTSAACVVAQADFTAAPQAGDLLVAFVNEGNFASGHTTPLGWTSKGFEYFNDGDISDGSLLTCFVKAWSNTDTTYTFAGTVSPSTVQILVISGGDVSSTDAFAASGAYFGGTSGTTNRVMPAYTTATANELLIGAAINYGNASGTFTSTGTMTSRDTTTNTSGLFSSVIATQDVVSAGAVPTITFSETAGGFDWSWCGILIAVKLPVVGGATVPLRSLMGVGL